MDENLVAIETSAIALRAAIRAVTMRNLADCTSDELGTLGVNLELLERAVNELRAVVGHTREGK